MEDIKEKFFIAFGIIIFLCLCSVAYYYLFVGTTLYYTQVDNTKIEEITSDDNMKYEYTLDCYKKDGKKKTITFKTSRELREGAFLEIEYMEISGVHSWKEVKYNELPKKVKISYSDD